MTRISIRRWGFTVRNSVVIDRHLGPYVDP
jgi:hypothetical protein